jgi:hypothetical protein
LRVITATPSLTVRCTTSLIAAPPRFALPADPRRHFQPPAPT